MIGFIVKYLGRNFKVGSSESDATLNVTLVRNEFILEGSSGQPYISSFQLQKDGIELDVEVAECDEASIPITADNYKDTCQIDPLYIEMIDKQKADVDWNLKCKLEEFRKLEEILKEENLI